MITKNSIITQNGEYQRFAIKTHFINVGEDFLNVFEKYVLPYCESNDIVFCSEKIVALCQGRVVKKQDMRLSLLARFLSRFASRPQGGVGVAEPYKMQFAIDTVGALKVIYASVLGGFCKIFGKKGVFYEIVGNEVSGLDGFYNKVWEEYGDMGILIPENSAGVCDTVYNQFAINMVIVDASDWGQALLGKSSHIAVPDNVLLDIIKDNPAGQGKECTPFIVARKITTE